MSVEIRAEPTPPPANTAGYAVLGDSFNGAISAYLR